MNLDCPKCGNKFARRLISAGTGLACDKCFVPPPVGRDAILNRSKCNKWAPGMTVADAERIKTNTKCPDGRFRPAPRWRTAGDM